MNPISVYAQEQWTLKRWTLNGGLRFDRLKTSYDATNIGPTRWLPVARQYPGADVLNWKDLSPRVGVSWDLLERNVPDQRARPTEPAGRQRVWDGGELRRHQRGDLPVAPP